MKKSISYAKISVTRLVEKDLKMARGMVTAWKNGVSRPSRVICEKIAQVFNVDVDYLTNDTAQIQAGVGAYNKNQQKEGEMGVEGADDTKETTAEGHSQDTIKRIVSVPMQVKITNDQLKKIICLANRVDGGDIQKFSQTTGVEYDVIVGWLTHDKEPDIDSAKKICKAFLEPIDGYLNDPSGLPDSIITINCQKTVLGLPDIPGAQSGQLGQEEIILALCSQITELKKDKEFLQGFAETVKSQQRTIESQAEAINNLSRGSGANPIDLNGTDSR